MTIDRMRTPSATAKGYLRFRTPAVLSAAQAAPLIARGDVGASSVAIHAVKLLPATAPVLRLPVTAGDCGTATTGGCSVARSDVYEYAWEVTGPDVLAVHAIDGLARAEAPADVAAIDAPPIDVSPAENAAVVGASVFRAQKQTFVLEPAVLPAPSTLSYSVPAGNPSRHVVFDAPADAMGRTTVTATVRAGRCAVSLAAGPGVTGLPTIFTLATAAQGCTVSEDANVAPGQVSPGMGGFDRPPGSDAGTGPGGSRNGNGNDNGAAGAGGADRRDGAATGSGVTDDRGAVVGGCACGIEGAMGEGVGVVGALALMAFALARWRRRAGRAR